jgi:hypothetical protein
VAVVKLGSYVKLSRLTKAGTTRGLYDLSKALRVLACFVGLVASVSSPSSKS